MVLDLLFMFVGLALFFALTQHHQWARQRLQDAPARSRLGITLFAGLTALLPVMGIGIVTYFVAGLLSPGGEFVLLDRQILALLMGYCLGLILLQGRSA